MILGIDTAYKHLSLVLIKDGKVIASYSELAFKKQSEEIFVRLEGLFKKHNLNKKELKAIYLSIGPGSYTGLRIALTLAKVLGQLNNLELYTIDTLRLYSANKENTMVIMDARANRAYAAIFDQDKIIKPTTILNINDLKTENYNLVGDLSLIGLDNFYYDMPSCFLNNLKNFTKVTSISSLTPNYFKTEKDYYR